MTSFADVDAGVRAAIAAYTLALDDGRTDDVVATFCAAGSVEIPGLGAHAGQDALRAAYTKVEPRWNQRHLVTNTLIAEWSEREARATSDVVFLLQDESGWDVKLVGRYDDTLHNEDGVWRFHHRKATFR